MPDPSLLARLALVHPYRHKQPNHAAWPPSAAAGEGASGSNTTESGSGSGSGSGGVEEGENMRRKREAFTVPDV